MKPDIELGRSFPKGFLWGAATSAYQVEGAVAEDGRRPSIWDVFAHEPGRVRGATTGDDACEHYRRYRSDIALAAELGISAYRFSVSWPRVLPDGGGAINQRGLDFYDRLTDTLLEHGITPALTLYHWDLPQALQDRGGWGRRETVELFARYTDIVASRLADRVGVWITHNEPWVASFEGHATGNFAPGLTDWALAAQAAHHLLLSHGRAVQVLRRHKAASVGISLNMTPTFPASEAPEDAIAAARADEYINRWFLEPIFRRRYPERFWRRLEERGCAPEILDRDLDDIGAAIDFLGINYYAPAAIAHAPDRADPLAYEHAPSPWPVTDLGWPISAQALTDLLVRVAADYSPETIYITENGAAFDDAPPVDGRVHDHRRVAYLRDHLLATVGAIRSGAPVRGYFAWSLLDCFEWLWGYSAQFGIVHVDRETQVRTPKDSANFLRSVAGARACSRQLSNGTP